MKKSSFITLILGTVSGVLFSLGMCMALIPDWNAFRPGVTLGCVGLFLAFVTLMAWRKMEHKAPIQFSGKAILTASAAIIGALALGIGMCFSMVWGQMAVGIAVGLTGIIILLCLIPLTKGIKA